MYAATITESTAVSTETMMLLRRYPNSAGLDQSVA